MPDIEIVVPGEHSKNQYRFGGNLNNPAENRRVEMLLKALELSANFRETLAEAADSGGKLGVFIQSSDADDMALVFFPATPWHLQKSTDLSFDVIDLFKKFLKDTAAPAVPVLFYNKITRVYLMFTLAIHLLPDDAA